MNFKEFTENDWFGFAGAQSFKDGRKPLIAVLGKDTDPLGACAVIDKNGMGVYFNHDVLGECDWFLDSSDENLITWITKFFTEEFTAQGLFDILDKQYQLRWDA